KPYYHIIVGINMLTAVIDIDPRFLLDKHIFYEIFHAQRGGYLENLCSLKRKEIAEGIRFGLQIYTENILLGKFPNSIKEKYPRRYYLDKMASRFLDLIKIINEYDKTILSAQFYNGINLMHLAIYFGDLD